MTIYVSVALGEFSTDSGYMIFKGISVHGWPSGHALDCQDAIGFAQRQGVKCMIETHPLDKVDEAWESMLSGKVRFRGVLTMD